MLLEAIAAVEELHLIWRTGVLEPNTCGSVDPVSRVSIIHRLSPSTTPLCLCVPVKLFKALPVYPALNRVLWAYNNRRADCRKSECLVKIDLTLNRKQLTSGIAWESLLIQASPISTVSVSSGGPQNRFLMDTWACLYERNDGWNWRHRMTSRFIPIRIWRTNWVILRSTEVKTSRNFAETYNEACWSQSNMYVLFGG